jgi:hypothetical protein
MATKTRTSGCGLVGSRVNGVYCVVKDPDCIASAAMQRHERQYQTGYSHWGGIVVFMERTIRSKTRTWLVVLRLKIQPWEGLTPT